MSNFCENCVHNPICEWVEENHEVFFRPKGECDHCGMFCNAEECYEPAESKACGDTAYCCDFDHTIGLMRSDDYKKRFKAEYLQTKIRYEKLKAINTRIEAEERTKYKKLYVKVDEPKHACPADILREQQSVMSDYLHILELRAVIEGIEL